MVMDLQEHNVAGELVEIIKKDAELVRRNKKAAEAMKEFWETEDLYDSPFFRAIDAAMQGNSSDLILYDMPKRSKIYRAREVHTEDIKIENGIVVSGTGYLFGFDEDNSMEAPLGKATAGRNNIRGVSYLYAAEDMATACAEIKTVPKSLISVAEIELVSDIKIFDFCNGFYTTETGEDGTLDVGALFTEAAMQFYRPVGNENEYGVTQLIADYVRKTGVDGIAYRSFFTGKKNYTIFNSHKSKVRFKESRLVANQGAVSYYWDFNDAKCIIAKQNGVEYEEAHSDDVRQMVTEALKCG